MGERAARRGPRATRSRPVPVKQPESAMSPERRRQEVAALLGLAVRRLAKRPGTGERRAGGLHLGDR